MKHKLNDTKTNSNEVNLLSADWMDFSHSFVSGANRSQVQLEFL